MSDRQKRNHLPNLLYKIKVGVLLQESFHLKNKKNAMFVIRFFAPTFESDGHCFVIRVRGIWYASFQSVLLLLRRSASKMCLIRKFITQWWQSTLNYNIKCMHTNTLIIVPL